ncbi:hypothetical protein ACHAWX_002922 [Stephanocyclus meneghinianus]
MRLCSLCLISVFAQTAGCRLDLSAFAIQQPRTFRVENVVSRQLPNSALFYRNEPRTKKDPPLVESDDIEEKIETEEPIQDNEVWMTATRTLGSLFLHQEDAKRDHSVSNETAYDGSASFPFHESTLSAYLLNLKRQEEVNREKSSTQQKADEPKPGKREPLKELSTGFQIDQKIARELDDSVTSLAIIDGMLEDLEILPQSEHETCHRKSERTLSEQADILRLSHPEHYEKRIGRDMRHLAVSIAASIDKPWQWKLFFDEGGGVLPLLECIRDGARSVEKGNADFMDGDVEGTAILMEQHEASFAAACTACRALRDLSALSKDFSAVVTDDILKVNEQWSTCVVEGKGYDCSSGGLVSDLLILLKHANDPTEIFKAPKKGRRTSFYLSSKRRRRDARRRCGLYVVQLMLAMAIASDKAVATLRSTSGLIEEVVQCSSYDPSERFRRKWIRKPLDFFRRKIAGLKKSQTTHTDGWIPSGLRGKMQENANKLLAALGHNIWVPKQPGQRGLRVLSLDGGGTRGIAAITSIRHIVDAMGGIEVCDAFDMIVGTSTGAIIAFLVGLRRESAADARIRYDTLIKRIFVKSLLKPIMLATTTASYDEANLMEVLDEILKDDGMLDSRANPAVPLVTAVSSKMSSTPSQLCLLRNYNYGGGEMPDSFCIDPDKARKRLGLDDDDVVQAFASPDTKKTSSIKCAPRTGIGSRYPGSFRVTQKIALRATTAAPTFFKPLLSFDELYVDGGIVASNPTAVAVHEARTVFPGVPLEAIVSVGTGGKKKRIIWVHGTLACLPSFCLYETVFTEIKVPPRVGWDGVVAQILDSATDGK